MSDLAKRKKKNIPSKVSRLLEIPQEVSTSLPKVTVVGFEKILIENYKSILEYQEFYIRISTFIGILNINGYELNLKEMTTDDLLVTGKIESIDFEAITDEE
jgi:sporulation protein YqfC